ncbi:thioredoxin-like domain-containing protein [Chitinophaga rhizosphaerae]|uniref:thioredoxin-like domain-containing protein n=1 Tax=Chitinophaga rhizosphaerae TaxID=1864947 RepID=UPI000F7FE591|nr:thioredoxin-like domain-containing protein [Chitinophaga rhizosphaerae]
MRLIKSLLILPVFMSLLLLAGCSRNSKIDIEIIGELSSLPDGKIYLLDGKSNKLDSTYSRNGRFSFVIKPGIYTEPALFTFEHLDSTENRRLFQFRTNKKLNGGGLMLPYFMASPGDKMVIEGMLKKFETVNVKLPEKLMLVYPDKLITGSKQNDVMYNEDFVSGETITDSIFLQLEGKVKHYPYSYYFLHELNKNLAMFSSAQARKLMACFDETVQRSPGAKKVMTRLNFRETKLLNRATLMKNREDMEKPVIDSTRKLNIVILWASWCGPCRKEIPLLKELHRKLERHPDVRMVSVSVDRKKADWLKAEAEEEMPWEQLWVPDVANTRIDDIFPFDGAIPTTLITDSYGKVLKRYTGFEGNLVSKYEKFINSLLAQE